MNCPEEDKNENYSRYSRDSNIPTRKNFPVWRKVLHTIDIFAYLPVPRTDAVSTK